MKKIGFMMLALVMLFALASCSSKEEAKIIAKDKSESLEVEAKKDVETSKEDEGKSEEAIEEATEESAENDRPDATDFIIADKDGNDIKLSDYEGKVIFVNMYATWCGYCVKEMPLFDQLMAEYPDDLAIVLIDVFQTEKQSAEDIYSWYDDFGYAMPMGVDTDDSVFNIYPVGQGFPTTYIIDKDFKVVGAYEGAMSEELARGIIDDLIAE